MGIIVNDDTSKQWLIGPLTLCFYICKMGMMTIVEPHVVLADSPNMKYEVLSECQVSIFAEKIVLIVKDYVIFSVALQPLCRALKNMGYYRDVGWGLHNPGNFIE